MDYQHQLERSVRDNLQIEEQPTLRFLPVSYSCYDVIIAAMRKDAHGPYLYTATAEQITADPSTDKELESTSPALPRDMRHNHLNVQANRALVIGNQSLKATEHTSVLRATYFHFRSRLNRLLTNLHLGRQLDLDVGIEIEMTDLHVALPLLSSQMPLLTIDSFLQRYAGDFYRSAEYPSHLFPRQPEDDYDWPWYYGRSNGAFRHQKYIPCHDLRQMVAGEPSNDLKAVSSHGPGTHTCLLDLPLELREMILGYICGTENNTIWAVHKYGPLCANRETALHCMAHKDALLYPRSDEYMLETAATSSPWPHDMGEHKAHLIKASKRAEPAPYTAKQIIKYTGEDGVENMLILPSQASVQLTNSQFHKLHVLDLRVMASCKQPTREMQDTLLRVKTIDIIPHHDEGRLEMNGWWGQRLTCGRCIYLLENARQLHIRCMGGANIHGIGKILTGRNNLSRVILRMDQLHFGPLKGIKVTGELVFERLAVEPYNDFGVAVLDVLVRDWDPEDQNRMKIFKELMRHGWAENSSRWQDAKSCNLFADKHKERLPAGLMRQAHEKAMKVAEDAELVVARRGPPGFRSMPLRGRGAMRGGRRISGSQRWYMGVGKNMIDDE